MRWANRGPRDELLACVLWFYPTPQYCFNSTTRVEYRAVMSYWAETIGGCFVVVVQDEGLLEGWGGGGG